MPGSRKALLCLFVFGLFALAAPVVALANGGSAGDQQYTDPLSGTKSPTTTSSPTTTQAPAPSTQTSAAPPPSSSTAPTPTQTSPASSAPPTSTPATPTATTAATTGTTTLSAAGARQLPYTGYDGRLAAGVGFLLVLGGIGLRRKLRRA